MTPSGKALILVGVAVAAAAGYGLRERRWLALASGRLAALGGEERILGEQVRSARNEAEELRSTRRNRTDPAAASAEGTATLALFSHVAQIRAQFERQPGQKIPEMGLLTEADWIWTAGTRHVDTEGGMRNAMSGVRTHAEERAAALLQQAMRAREAAQPGTRLTDMKQLEPYLPAALTPEMAGRYEVLPLNPDLGFDQIQVRRAAVPDTDFDHLTAVAVGVISFGVARDQTATQAAFAAYQAAHGKDAHPSTPEELAPYFQSPAAAAHYEEIRRLEQEALAP